MSATSSTRASQLLVDTEGDARADARLTASIGPEGLDGHDLATLEPVLRSMDAIHLATALEIAGDLDFITCDDRLAAAARAEGLRVVQPGRAAG